MGLLLAATVRCSSEGDSDGQSLVGKTVDSQSLLVGLEPQTISLGLGKRGATVSFPAGVTRSQIPITVNLNDGVKKRGATVGGPVVEIVTAAVAFEAPAKMRQPLPPPPVGKTYVAVSSQKKDGTWAIKRGGVRMVGSNPAGVAAGTVVLPGTGGRVGSGDGGAPGAGGATPVGGAPGAGGASGQADGGVPIGGGRAGGMGGTVPVGGVAGGADAGLPLGGTRGDGGSAEVGGSGGVAGAGAGGAPVGGTVGGAGFGGTTPIGGTAGTSQSTFTQLAEEETLFTYEIDILGTGYWGIALEDEGSGTGPAIPYAFECPPAAKLASCGFSFLPTNIDPCTTLPEAEAVCLHLCLEPSTCTQIQTFYCGSVPHDPASVLLNCVAKCGGSKNTQDTPIPCGQSGEFYYDWQRCDGFRNCSDSADEMGCEVRTGVDLYCPDGTPTRDDQGSNDMGSTMTAPAADRPAIAP